jgi:hypothetical protein
VQAARHLIAIAWLAGAMAGCSFRVLDGGPVTPDAPICEDTGTTCADATTLRACTQGQAAIDTPCPWGCLGPTAPRCGQLQPTGEVVAPADLNQDPRLKDGTATAEGTPGVINTLDGSITNLRGPGIGVVDDIDFEVRDVPSPLGGGLRQVGVFRLAKLTLTGEWLVRGPNALAIVSLGDVVIQGRLDLLGDCMSTNAGPGGARGGSSGADAPGPGGGKRGMVGTANNDSSGGGGGGYGAEGGDGGVADSSPAIPSGGGLWGDPAITQLLGGSGGGGGGGGGVGGGGGGAIHIVANGKVSILADQAVQPSGINAGGCGGERSNNDAGGGGGSGGAILIEAAELELDNAHLAVNGGGGGGANSAGATAVGTDGVLGATRAAGGLGGSGVGNGGAGGAAGTLRGDPGDNAANDGGGGGGGVGRIRVNTRLVDGVTAGNGALVSPSFDEPGTTATRSTGVVQ